MLTYRKATNQSNVSEQFGMKKYPGRLSGSQKSGPLRGFDLLSFVIIASRDPSAAVVSWVERKALRSCLPAQTSL